MPTFFPQPMLYLLAAVVLAAALTRPPFVLLVADLGLSAFQGEWDVGGSRVDISDVVLVGIAISLTVHRRRSPAPPIPGLGRWVALGYLMSASYLVAAGSQGNLTDPGRVAYQLYRYCWKPILFYPLAFMLLRDRSKVALALLAVVLAADSWCFQGIGQGYQGLAATGPFNQKNSLAGALLMVFVVSLSGSLVPPSRRHRIIHTLSSVLIARTLLFANSRGAIVGVILAAGILAWGLLSAAHFRAWLLRMGLFVLLAMVVAFLFKPDLLEGPNVRYLTTAKQGSDAETMQWRQEERWPHFTKIVLANPWPGIGTDVDLNLGDSGNTPHNGYLSLALTYGVPASLLIVSFAVSGILRGLQVFQRGGDPWRRVFGLTTTAALSGFLLHNHVDSTIAIAFAAKLMWLLVGVVAAMERRPGAFGTAVSGESS